VDLSGLPQGAIRRSHPSSWFQLARIRLTSSKLFWRAPATLHTSEAELTTTYRRIVAFSNLASLRWQAARCSDAD
jgi:hypothetical protein